MSFKQTGNIPYTYLDAAATAPLHAEARAAMLEALDGGPGNPSSVHTAGHRAQRRLQQARDTIATTFHVRPDEVVFTSGGTEANNLGVIGLALARPRGRHIVTTPIEHPAVLESCSFLERVHGFEVTQLPVDAQGRVAVEAVAPLLREQTTLLTVGLANGEVGTVQQLPEIAALAHARGVPVHTDAVQAAASLPVSLAQDGWPGAHVTALSIASHKFGGPQGCGALLVRSGVPIEPILHGGGQERGRRSGTENVAAIVGFAAAVKATRSKLGSRSLALAASRNALVSRVVSEVPGVTLTGHPDERLPGHASFLMGQLSGESVLVALDAAGIAASSGSACAAGNDAPSPTLVAMGVPGEAAQTAVRFSLPYPVSTEIIERIVQVMRTESIRAQSKRGVRSRAPE